MRSHLAVLLTLGLAACGDQLTSLPETAPSSTSAIIQLAPPAERANLISTSGVWSKQFTGQTSSGALYAMFVPQNWNGDVAYYAHGIVDAAMPIALPEGDGFPDLRDALGSLGYAVAYSSFSENGWAEKDGVQSTHQLRELFQKNVGKPRRSYLMGTSMGGLVAEDMSERYGDQYDGTLAMCAPLGGALQEVNYIANVRVLFDVVYPGVLPGDVIHVPANMDPNTQVLGPAQAAVFGNPTGLGVIASMRQTPLAGNDGTELATSLLYALVYDVRGINDFLGRTHGRNMFDNSTTKYEAIVPGLLPPQILAYVNAAAGRFQAHPEALQYLNNYYVPNGRFRSPIVTLHTTRDPLVPFFHEASFASITSSSGNANKVVQRSVDRFGHCAFTAGEMVDAFQSLTNWVSTGQRPAN